MNKNLGKGISTVGMLIALVVMVFIAGGIYFYLNSQSPKTENEPSASINSEIEKNTGTEVNLFQEEDLSQLGPKEVWIKMREEVDKVETMDELFIVSKKYASKEKIVFWDSQMDQYNSMSQALKDGLFSMMKDSLPMLNNIDIDGIQIEIAGDSATLKISTKDLKERGEVTLIREDGIWRIEEEVW